MPARREKKRTYPFTFHCSQCSFTYIVHAEDAEAANIKIAGRGWKCKPPRCLDCVASGDKKRTGVLEVRT